jgi:hypothetical protein
MYRRPIIWCAAAAFCLLVTAPTMAQLAMFRDRVGKKAPEISPRKKHIFNADKPPKLRDLQGHVVWLEFGFIA